MNYGLHLKIDINGSEFNFLVALPQSNKSGTSRNSNVFMIATISI